MRNLFIILNTLFILTGHQVRGQDQFFHEFFLEKEIHENEKWALRGEANWKHIYDDVGWRRWGISFVGVRKIKQLNLLAGMNGYYTFNKKIVNFFELRPWLGVNFNIPLLERVKLTQGVKFERRFFYEAEEPVREDYNRLRYKIGFDIPLSKENEHAWKVRPWFEWFFIRNPASFERFPNERDFGLTCIKRLKNEHEISFAYNLEVYYDTTTDDGNGHLISIGYSF